MSTTREATGEPRLDIARIHAALLAIGESEIRYLIDEGKYLEAASRIVEEDLAAQIRPNYVTTTTTLRPCGHGFFYGHPVPGGHCYGALR